MNSCVEAYRNTSIAGNLSRIGQITQGDALSAQGWTELNSFTDNPFTHKDGFVIKQIEGNDYVAVDMFVIPQGQRPANSIAGLAAAVKDTEKRVLNAILRYGNNAWILPYLYQQTRGGTNYPGHASARRYLLSVAHEEFRPNDGLDYAIRYKTWALPVRAGHSITLPPLTPEFRCEIFRHRLQAQKGELRELRSRTQFFIESLREKTATLKSDIESFNRILQPYMADVSAITGARMLMDVMIAHPKDPNQARDREVEAQRNVTKNLEEIAMRDFITSPRRGTVERMYKNNRDSSALSLRKVFENSELIKITMIYRRYKYLITTSLYDQLCKAMAEAVLLLMQSPQAKYIQFNWATRLINIIDQDSIQQNEAEANITIDDAVTACDGVLLGLSMVPAAVGNMPGPASFAVALMNCFSHKLVGQALANPNDAKKIAQILVRFMVRWGGLSSAQKSQLDDMLANPPNQKTIGMWVKNRFQGSRNWGLFLGIFNAALLIHSIRSSESETIRDWITLGNLSLASSSGASFVQALKSIERMRNCGLVTIGGEALGVMAGVFALAVSIDAAAEEWATGDTHGAIINVVGAVGAGLSLAGYLIGAGLAADATVFGAPLGAVLMVAGIVIGVASAVWGFLRLAWTTHTHIQYEAYINYIAEDDGGSQKLWRILKYHADDYFQFSSTYERVQKHHGLSFWYIAESQCDILFNDILHNCQQVANAMDLSDSDMANNHSSCCTLEE